MKTCQFHFIALLSISAVCADDPPVPSPPPKNLQVAHLSPHEVFLRWDSPEDTVNLTDVKFEVTVNTQGQVNPLKYSEKNLYMVLDSLHNNTEYTVVVTLVKADTSNATSDPLVFKTLMEDEAAPSGVELRDQAAKGDLVLYKVSWNFTQPEQPAAKLAGFEVLFCSTACEAKSTQATDRSVEYGLSWSTDYVVTVSAVYGDSEATERKVSGALATLKSVSKPPGEVSHLECHQEKDTLDLKVTWTPPAQDLVPVASYELDLSMPNKTIFSVNVTDPAYNYTIAKKSDVSDSYIFKIRAIGIDHQSGEYVEFPYNLQKPAPPTNVNLTSRTTDSISFDIERQSDAALKFRITRGNSEPKLSNDRKQVIDGLQAFSDVEIGVAVCLPLDGDEVLCGEPAVNKFQTETGAPSEVQSLSVDDTDGKPKLTWKEPKNPSGPIDGYILKIADTTDDTNSMVHLEKVHEYSFTDVKNCTSYEFIVSAFNKRLSDPRIKLDGKPSVVEYKSKNCDEPASDKAFPTWAIVLIVLVVIGAVGGGAFYYFKMRQ